MHRPNPCPTPLTTTVLPSNRIRIGPTSIDPLPRRAILPQSPKSTNPTAPAVGAIGGNDARKACLWHGPGVLSLVADRYAPGSRVAGQRPRRARRHRQPGALGLGGPRRLATGGEPAWRSQGDVDRKSAGQSLPGELQRAALPKREQGGVTLHSCQ